MNIVNMIGFNTIVLSVLVLVPIEYSNAEQTDIAVSECLLEVQEAMTREEIKQLYVADQQKVKKYCKRGRVEGAIQYVESIGAHRRCVRDLDLYIDDKQLNVPDDTLRNARLQCRQGGLQQAIEAVSVAPTNTPISSAEKIISFVSSSTSIDKGSSATLSWSTKEANIVMLGREGTTDFFAVETSGSRSVSPDKTTIYVLMAGQSTNGPTTMQSSKLELEVSVPPNGTCSIVGELSGKWQRLIKENPTGPSSMWTVGVGIYIADSNSPFATIGASVNKLGRYRINDLSAGKNYIVRPSWASTPREGNISCTQGGIHKGPNFKVTGGPKID